MDLSIIVLNYKTKAFLRQYIKGVFEQNWNFNFEVIIVDNNSNDGSVEMLKEEFLNNQKYESLNLKLIESNKNTGHSIGNNIGIEKASGRYVLISNTDIIYFNPNDMKKMLDYMNNHQDIAVLGPKLKNADGSIQDNCLRFYKFSTILNRRSFFSKTPWGKKDLERFSMHDFDHQKIKDVDWIMGAQQLIRKDFLEAAGNLDDRFFLYFADTDICKQAWLKNKRVVYYPDVNIIHYHKRESAKSLRLKDIFGYTTRLHIKDWRRYIKKYGIKNSSTRKNN